MDIRSNIYEFKYEGDFVAVDAVTVLHTQLGFIAILTEIKNQIAPESKLNVKLQGLEKGSLEVHQLVELAIPAGMFALNTYDTIKKVFDIFGDLYKIKDFLGGKKASEERYVDNSIHLTLNVNGNNNNLVVSPEAWGLYTSNPKINDMLVRTAKSLQESEEVNEVSVKRVSQDRPVVRIDRDSFDRIKQENPYSDTHYHYEPENDQVIGIKRANLAPEPGRVFKWDVLYRGQTISIKITDQDFISQVINGLRFGNGDKLKVDIKKAMRFDKTFNMFVEAGRYEAVKVHKIIPREEQTTIDFQE